MSTETLLLLVVIVLIAGVFPAWPHSKSWGYGPTGVLTLLLIVFVVWAIAGDRPLFRSTLGGDIKSTGRDVASSIRRTVQ